MKAIKKTLPLLLVVTVVVIFFAVSAFTASATTTFQNKVVTIAKNSSKYNITAKKRYAQKWVSDVYQKATGTYYGAASAKDVWNKWGATSKKNIPVGTVVYGSTGTNGHCGIYIGNNKVAHNVGYVQIQSLSIWQKSYKYLGWGRNGKDLETTKPSGGSIKPIKSLGPKIAVTYNNHKRQNTEGIYRRANFEMVYSESA